jgi:hypothetical protein
MTQCGGAQPAAAALEPASGRCVDCERCEDGEDDEDCGVGDEGLRPHLELYPELEPVRLQDVIAPSLGRFVAPRLRNDLYARTGTFYP